jgi:hypothetical protein
LSGSVPELETQGFALDLHGLGDEIDADCGLNDARVTLAVNSKESWMNLDIIEVFPTFWSPTSTTLNLLSLDMY